MAGKLVKFVEKSGSSRKLDFPWDFLAAFWFHSSFFFLAIDCSKFWVNFGKHGNLGQAANNCGWFDVFGEKKCCYYCEVLCCWAFRKSVGRISGNWNEWMIEVSFWLHCAGLQKKNLD